MTQQSLPPVPNGYNTVNPFIITQDALKVIEFLKTLFGAEEDMTAHTVDTDGLLLHSELVIGDSRLFVVNTKPDWPFTPSLLQVYVDDVEATLKRAEELGEKIITQPTDFYGDLFSRLIDPWNNVWWIYQHQPQAGGSWGEATSTTESADSSVSWQEGASTSESWEPTEELQYIRNTIVEAMKSLGKGR
jgi:uncharacterized glyoxalase superfamily protein PhnB